MVHRPDSMREMGDRLRQEFQDFLGGDLAHGLIDDGLSVTDFQEWCNLEQAIYGVLQISAELDALEQQLTSGFLPIDLVAQNQALLEHTETEQRSDRAGQPGARQPNQAIVNNPLRDLDHFPFMTVPTSLHRFVASHQSQRGNEGYDNSTSFSEHRIRQNYDIKNDIRTTQSPEVKTNQPIETNKIRMSQREDSSPVLINGAEDIDDSDSVKQTVIPRFSEITYPTSHSQEHPFVDLHPLHPFQSVERAVFQSSSPDQTARSQSLDPITRSQSLDQIARSQSLDPITRSQSLDPITRSQSLDQTARSQSLEQTARSQSLDQAGQSYSLDQTARSQSLDQTARSQFLDQTTRSHFPGQSSQLQHCSDAPSTRLSEEYLIYESAPQIRQSTDAKPTYLSASPTRDPLIASSDSAKQTVITRFPETTYPASHSQEYPLVDLHPLHPSQSVEIASSPPASPRVIGGLSALAEGLETYPAHLFTEHIPDVSRDQTQLSLSDSGKQEFISRFPDVTDPVSYSQNSPLIDPLDGNLTAVFSSISHTPSPQPPISPFDAVVYPTTNRYNLDRSSTVNQSQNSPLVEPDPSHPSLLPSYPQDLSRLVPIRSELETITVRQIQVGQTFREATPSAVPSHARYPTEQQEGDAVAPEFPATPHSELDLEQVMDAISREIAREYRYFYGD